MSPETWESFFLGEVGAAAALGGLLFVAVSINVAKIIDVPGLADRALQALLILLSLLTIAALMLMPEQSMLAMGIEVIVVTAVTMVVGTLLGLRGLRQSEAAHRSHFVWSIISFEIVFLVSLLGGIIVLAGNPAGLYWLAIGMCLGFIKAVSDAWIFLVEINR